MPASTMPGTGAGDEVAEKQASEAKANLRLLKITSAERFVMAHPHQGWSLEAGANHFDEDPPDAVAKKLAELVRKGFVNVEVLGADAKSTPWRIEQPTESKSK